ncbi:MAG: beta-glucosidase [Clostridiales bacterium]|nr:beta-glucosidase [Clostridiales bacterium]
MEIYQDRTQPVAQRVEDLLSKMTLEEKAAQLCGNLPASFVVNSEAQLSMLREKFPHGHGRFTQYSLVGLAHPERIARISNQVQRYFVEETRLGIPVALQSENLSGYPAAGGTLFPAMINLASTWEPALAGRIAAVIGQESRSVGINSAMSPVIDVARDPRWGRMYETFGEDPYLVSQMGIRYIQGMQGDKQSGVACIAKHFLGYSETQGGLNTAVSRITDRELYEVFATPFEAAAKEADVSGMMASYSEIDGMPVAMNPQIARTLLRKTMGYRGMLTSDGAGVLKLFTYFRLTKDYPQAGLLAKLAGLDTEIPVGDSFKQLPEFVRQGKIDEAILDESVRRVLTIKFEYGLFDHPYVDEGKVAVSMANEEKWKLSDEAAAKSITLLQNNGILPLAGGLKLAVVGPHADSLRYPVSGYTFPAYIEMLAAGAMGSEAVTIGGLADEDRKVKQEGKAPEGAFASMAKLFSAEDRGVFHDVNALLRRMGSKSLAEALGERFEVVYAQGCDIVDPDPSGIARAVIAAEKSDVVVMAAGGNCGWVNVTGGEGKDRCRLDLPGAQQELLEAVCATGKPVVLVLYGPGYFSLPWAKEHAAAVIQAWMPGVNAGRVLADVLDGTVNPGGKLPVTVARSVGQVPVNYNHRTGSGYSTATDSANAAIFSGGYVDEDSRPLYPFGYGLSYTAFTLSDFAVESETVPTDGVIRVRIKVRNAGAVPGDEVVQMYTHFSDAHVIRPVKQLAGFLRVSLQPGEEKTVRFTLDTAQLGYYNETMDFVVEPGRMEAMVGTSADDIEYTTRILLTGKPRSVMGKRKYTCRAECL